MNVDCFVRARQPNWRELDELVCRARGRPERLGPDGVRRVGALYRGAVADLAHGRRAFPGDPAVGNLEDLVRRARAAIYVAEPRRPSAGRYLARDYWRGVNDRRRLIALAWGLTLVSTALAAVWAAHDPGAAARLLPIKLANGGAAPTRAIGLAAERSAALSVSIFTHNISVTFLAFASGILLGIGPAVLLLFNGLILGAVAGIAASHGHAGDVIELIVPHGMLELSCIVVCAAAGMRMGWTLVEPGTRVRAAALSAEAPRAVLLVLATAPWLVVAGLVEGFITPHHLAFIPALAVGFGLAIPYWGLVWVLGRRPARQAHRRSRALAVR
ncbi:MAG: stage II sporulation protein M [Actinomycetota bacterium]|nr:stage II sporulation protein M [Actinomycetota bacterium]